MTDVSHPVSVVVFLSGPRRGETLRIEGESLTLGSRPDADVWLPPENGEEVIEARLVAGDSTYELVVADGRTVWVNGEPATRRGLATGDLIEIGETGALLRYRAYPAGSPAWKTMSEAFNDCVDCAYGAGPSALSRALAFVAGVPRELATQTPPSFRILAALTLILLAATVTLGVNSMRLRHRLRAEGDRITLIAELLERSEEEALRRDDLTLIRSELAEEIDDAERRLEALEGRSEAAARIIGEASRSVVFLQGAYGFAEADGDRPLRFVGGIAAAQGQAVGFEGDGPVVESLYTGTGFVVSEDGLVMTNRHVALPWEHDKAAEALTRRGLVPVMRRFIGYLPGRESAFAVELVRASEEADVALLRIHQQIDLPTPLTLGALPPDPGEEVIVMGYPAGMRALVARTDPSFVSRLTEGPPVDFWKVAEMLSSAGQIGPLASRGIVGQVSGTAVVYDAETTQGGSGGPVLDLDARVVAVNSAILPEFGGSNLGVPAAEGLKILLQTDPEGPAVDDK